MPPMKMVHAIDPAQELMAKVGDLSTVELFHNKILLATYIPPETTKSGIILTSKTRDESKWQGKAHLVIKKGPLAFVDDEISKFHGQSVEVGDWVFIRVADGVPLDVNGVRCRIVEEAHIMGRISSPDVVF